MFKLVRMMLLLMIAMHVAYSSYGSIPGLLVGERTHIDGCTLDSIVLLSSGATCRGGDPILTVSGTNITWYADAARTKMLAQGNTYHSTSLDATTTFYLTQTIDGIESPVQAIIIEVVEAFLLDVLITPASCGKEDGTMTVKAKGGTARYPVYFGLNDGPLQTTPFFSNLAGGDYKLTIWVAGCFGEIIKTVGQEPSPVIAAIDSISPKCGNDDGYIRIAAYGGSGTLRYSLNESDFQEGNIFENLTGGEYKVVVKDDSSCTVSQSVTLRKTFKPRLNSVEVKHTTCGKANGQVTAAAEGNGKLSYSLTNYPDQTSPVFSNLNAGSYQITVHDEDGCTDAKSIIIEDSSGPATGSDDACDQQFYLPAAFTPNNDGINDRWVIFFPVTSLEIKELIIYNRWGEVVFSVRPGTITSGTMLWDGSCKGRIAKGLFTYQLRIATGNSRVYKGSITVL